MSPATCGWFRVASNCFYMFVLTSFPAFPGFALNQSSRENGANGRKTFFPPQTKRCVHTDPQGPALQPRCSLCSSEVQRGVGAACGAGQGPPRACVPVGYEGDVGPASAWSPQLRGPARSAPGASDARGPRVCAERAAVGRPASRRCRPPQARVPPRPPAVLRVQGPHGSFYCRFCLKADRGHACGREVVSRGFHVHVPDGETRASFRAVVQLGGGLHVASVPPLPDIRKHFLRVDVVSFQLNSV